MNLDRGRVVYIDTGGQALWIALGVVVSPANGDYCQHELVSVLPITNNWEMACPKCYIIPKVDNPFQWKAMLLGELQVAVDSEDLVPYPHRIPGEVIDQAILCARDGTNQGALPWAHNASTEDARWEWHRRVLREVQGIADKCWMEG